MGGFIYYFTNKILVESFDTCIVVIKFCCFLFSQMDPEDRENF